MKTGIHCNTTRGKAKLLDYYRRSGAKVVKVMTFDPPVLDALKAMGITIIGRRFREHQDLDDRNFIYEIVSYATGYRQVDYWEGFNEAFSDGKEMNDYAEYEIERMKALEAVGAKAAIACFSTGTPETYDWVRFRPALEHAHAHGHALALHEYSGPFMQWMCGANQWDYERNAPTRIDDPCLSPTVEGWLTLRYRKAYKLFAAWGLADLPLFITEGGIDDVTPRPGGQGKGYKDFAGTEWAQVHGDYPTQRRWYMGQVSRDKYVKGVVDFGWDTEDPTWRSFDLSTDSATLDRLIAVEADLPDIGTPGDNHMTIQTFLLSEAAKTQVVKINDDSGFQKLMAKHGYIPVGDEQNANYEGATYRYQTAGKALDRQAQRVYAAKAGDWGNIFWIDRPKV